MLLPVLCVQCVCAGQGRAARGTADDWNWVGKSKGHACLFRVWDLSKKASPFASGVQGSCAPNALVWVGWGQSEDEDGRRGCALR